MDVITISIARGQSTAEAKKYAEKAMQAAQEAAGYAAQQSMRSARTLTANSRFSTTTTKRRGKT